MMPLLEAAGTDQAKLETLGLVFSNLEVACKKSLRPNLARLFDALARSCAAKAAQGVAETDVEAFLEKMLDVLKEQRTGAYEQGRLVAEEAGARGVLRAMVWGQKVTGIQTSLLSRLLAKGKELLGPDEKIHVCSACGFVIVKAAAPDACPICKAPQRQFVSF